MTKQEAANRVLWIAFILALVASLVHMSWVFGRLEFGDQRWLGWLPSIALNLALAALAYMIQQRKLAQRPTLDLWLGVVGLIGVSAFANLLYALAVQIQGDEIVWATFGEVDALDLVRAVSMSAILPLFVVYLGNVVSADDVARASSHQRLPAKTGASEGGPSAVQTFLTRVKPAWQSGVSTAKSWLASRASSPDASPTVDEARLLRQPEETPSPKPEPTTARAEQHSVIAEATAEANPAMLSSPATRSALPASSSRPSFHRPSFTPPPLLSNPSIRRSQGTIQTLRHRSSRPPARPYQALQRLRKRAGTERVAALGEM